MIIRSIKYAATLLLLGCSTQANSDVIEDFLGNALACTLIEQTLLANMPVQPLHYLDNGECVASSSPSNAQSWYADAQCQTPVSFQSTSMGNFCEQAQNKTELGSAIGVVPDMWTLTPGNKINGGARSLNGVTQPYMQRTVYKSVSTDRGECELEMRIYKSHPGATGQQSMLALHGGSWSARGFGFLGLELTVPHYVNRGFTVYAPFYRLLGDAEGNAACNQASFDDVVADAESALEWVQANAQNYGSLANPMLFGQSAGGHLALSLAANQSEQVSGAVLFYPPTDFTDFLQRVQQGKYTNAKGLAILDSVLGESASQATQDTPLVYRNSFPVRVQNEGIALPPMLIVQGASDTLVESRQAVRLCDAIAGNSPLLAVDEEAPSMNELREITTCTDNTTPATKLHLVEQGDHALDVCLNSLVPSTCPSGSESSRALVSQSVADAVDFSVAAAAAFGASTGTDEPTETPDTSDTTEDTTEKKKLGMLHFPSLLLLLGVFLWRKRSEKLRLIPQSR